TFILAFTIWLFQLKCIVNTKDKSSATIYFLLDFKFIFLKQIFRLLLTLCQIKKFIRNRKIQLSGC
ncbi:hypothetical protein B5V91_19185, partial [Heyndrickxia sporothermodurans]